MPRNPLRVAIANDRLGGFLLTALVDLYLLYEVLPYFAGKVLPYTDLPTLAPAVTSAGVCAGFAG